MVTRLGTFQKLYGQSELREYIQAVLEAEALPAANHLFVIPSFCPSPHDAPGPFRAAGRLSTISHCQATHKGSPSYTYEHRGTSVAHCNTGRSTPE